MKETTDISNVELNKGDVVMVDASCTDDPARVFRLSGGGFGCDIGSSGKIYGEYVATQGVDISSCGTCCTRRAYITGFADDEDIKLANEWHAMSIPELYSAIAGRKRSRINDMVHELANDDHGKVTKEQQRGVILQLTGEVNELTEMVREVADGK